MLGAKSCRVLCVETNNKNFECETGSSLAGTEGRDVEALGGPGYLWASGGILSLVLSLYKSFLLLVV